MNKLIYIVINNPGLSTLQGYRAAGFTLWMAEMQ